MFHGLVETQTSDSSHFCLQCEYTEVQQNKRTKVCFYQNVAQQTEQIFQGLGLVPFFVKRTLNYMQTILNLEAGSAGCVN